jgi:hypothetical protein
MSRTPIAPLRDVVSTRRGPSCQYVQLPGGSGGVAVLCGPRPFIDNLSCGHEHVTYGGKKATQRRCQVCLDEKKGSP